jgi:hypothetical protein
MNCKTQNRMLLLSSIVTCCFCSVPSGGGGGGDIVCEGQPDNTPDMHINE